MPDTVDDPLERHDVELYLLRHADAGDPQAWQGDDAQRPLSAKGRRQAEQLGQFLAARGFSPDVVVSSPKTRALETAELVAQPLGASVTSDERLGGALDLDTLAAIIDGLPGRRIVLVGHDPDFSELASTLCGAAYLALKKGALARLDVSLPLQPAGAILRWLLPPGLVAA
ncbi:MAG: histidine phosphatase family protein [Chloroflexota bacterium]|nr:histidine phosphatase family protein [Chloroflexota bacterium]